MKVEKYMTKKKLENYGALKASHTNFQVKENCHIWDRLDKKTSKLKEKAWQYFLATKSGQAMGRELRTLIHVFEKFRDREIASSLALERPDLFDFELEIRSKDELVIDDL